MMQGMPRIETHNRQCGPRNNTACKRRIVDIVVMFILVRILVEGLRV